MVGRQVQLTLVVLALALAGCAAPIVPSPASAPEPASDASATPMNLYLLDAPRPFSTTVSDGAEPIIHATRDGTTLLIGDWTGMYRSTDGGSTWRAAPNPFLEAFNVLADGWAIAEDDAGTIYAADTNGPIAGVAASPDNGASWTVQSKVVEVGDIVDRPWLAARGDGQVALISNTMRSGGNEICAMSTDGAQTFTSRSLVNHGRPNAGNVEFDSAGRLWFHNGVELWRWSAPCMNAPLPIDTPDSGPQIFTQVGLDAQDRVYFAQPTGDSSQMLLFGRAANGALKTLAVSAPELASNSFGAISVDKDTGEIAVGWYGTDTPGNPSVDSFNGAWNVYVTRVTDFWTPTPTLRTDRLTTEPNHVGDFCMGGVGCTTGAGDRDLLDYFGIDHGPDGTLHVAYGHDGTGSAAEVRYARLAP